MTWHYPDLYFFLFLLAGFATLLAIIYECIQKFRRKPPVVEPKRSNEKAVDPPSPPKHPPSPPKKYLENAKPLDGLQRARPRLTDAGRQAAERFSRLCESIEDLPPKEGDRR
jgi:hypothetical protein